MADREESAVVLGFVFFLLFQYSAQSVRGFPLGGLLISVHVTSVDEAKISGRRRQRASCQAVFPGWCL